MQLVNSEFSTFEVNLCNDVYAGEEAVHARGEYYLPRLPLQTDEQYESYLRRARLYNTFKQTIEVFQGMVFKNGLSIESLISDEVYENIDMKGNDLDYFVQKVFTETFISGNCGVLVDAPESVGRQTVAEAEISNNRPFLRAYNLLDIKTVKMFVVNNTEQIGQVELVESYNYQDAVGEITESTQVRILKLIDGVYTQEIHRDNEQIQIVTPMMNGKTLDYIPFRLMMEKSQQPLLLDLAYTCLHHYQLKADHVHGLLYTALPTPYILGVDPEDENTPNTIGPQKMWAIPNEQASVGMLEFTGAGIGQIVVELDALEKHMSNLGASFIAQDSTGNKTATEAAIEETKSTSKLISAVKLIESSLQKAISTWTEWGNFGELTLSMEVDYISNSIDAPMLTSLTNAYMQGGISQGTYLKNLQEAGLVEENKSIDDEIDEIDTEVVLPDEPDQ